MKARIKFRKYGALCFIGHLDVMRFFQKVMRRADIPIAFTGGYSPHMIMSFASPLGIGVTSDAEYFDIELTAPIASKEAVRKMNATMVDGIEVVSFRQIAEEKKMTGMAIVAAADYLVGIKKGSWPENLTTHVGDFMKQESICIIKQTKRSEAEVDIRPLIYHMEVRGGQIFMKLASGSVQNLKPELVMTAFYRFMGMQEEQDCFLFHRLEMYACIQCDEGKKLISLEELGEEIIGK